jgi:hypothetical protein
MLYLYPTLWMLRYGGPGKSSGNQLYRLPSGALDLEFGSNRFPSERKVREEEAVGFVSNRFRSIWGRKRATLKLEFGNV